MGKWTAERSFNDWLIKRDGQIVAFVTRTDLTQQQQKEIAEQIVAALSEVSRA